MIEDYLPPLVPIILIIMSICKWIHAIIITRNLRGLSAITARLYLLYAFVWISINIGASIDFKYTLLVLATGAILLDEAVFWLVSIYPTLVKNLTRKVRE